MFISTSTTILPPLTYCWIYSGVCFFLSSSLLCVKFEYLFIVDFFFECFSVDFVFLNFPLLISVIPPLILLQIEYITRALKALIVCTQSWLVSAYQRSGRKGYVGPGRPSSRLLNMATIRRKESLWPLCHILLSSVSVFCFHLMSQLISDSFCRIKHYHGGVKLLLEQRLGNWLLSILRSHFPCR